ncbi:MAG TPA: carboxyltransferase domain-containing protein, partial [Acidobacteriota bacterium]|nr:carboxyltransferase domain-containing protein [Acidobacteriota bacterium]
PEVSKLIELCNVEMDNAPEQAGEILRVPVCYEETLAPDLSFVADRTGLSIPEVIRLHSDTTYEVWMLGFMPGFPYLGKLPAKLTLPRKDRPSPRISAGSVAVAEEYTGVYPFDSPGGWHIVGRTPWAVTEYRRTPPWLFDYGMQVQFYPITIEEYRQSISATTAS